MAKQDIQLRKLVQTNVSPDADTTLAVASVSQFLVTPTTTRTYKLPSAGIKAGNSYTLYNAAAFDTGFDIIVNADDDSSIYIQTPQEPAEYIAKVDNPVTSTDWFLITHAVTNPDWVPQNVGAVLANLTGSPTIHTATYTKSGSVVTGWIRVSGFSQTANSTITFFTFDSPFNTENLSTSNNGGNVRILGPSSFRVLFGSVNDATGSDPTTLQAQWASNTAIGAIQIIDVNFQINLKIPQVT